MRIFYWTKTLGNRFNSHKTTLLIACSFRAAFWWWCWSFDKWLERTTGKILKHFSSCQSLAIWSLNAFHRNKEEDASHADRNWNRVSSGKSFVNTEDSRYIVCTRHQMINLMKKPFEVWLGGMFVVYLENLFAGERERRNSICGAIFPSLDKETLRWTQIETL